MRSTAFLGLILVAAPLCATSACQFNYDLVPGPDDLGGMAGNSTDAGSGGSGPSGGGTSSVGDSSDGGSDLGGSDSGGSDSGGSGGGDSGGGTSSGGASGGAGGASGGAGGTGGTSTSIVVTTTSDEQDSNATPVSPGGNGLSLREAILYANENPDHFEITFDAASMSINLGSPLPTITKTAHIVGNQTSIQAAGAGTNGPCVAVSGADVEIEGLFIFSCPTAPVAFLPGSGPGNLLQNCLIQNNDAPALIDGDSPTVLLNYWDSSDSTAIDVYAPSAEIWANSVVNPAGAGIYVRDTADGAYLLANVIINANPGIDLRALDGARLWHNTIVDGAGVGVNLAGTTNVDMRNNIVSGGNTYGVVGNNGQFTFFDYNLYYDNTSGNCSVCTLGPNDLTDNPLFVNSGGFPPELYRLQGASPAVDSGFDLGDDRNLSNPGLFNGTGPDRGYIEYE